MELNVAFLIFNRPEATRVVFEAIRAARPDRLFIVADGPRANKKGEAERCAAARRIVDNGVDWRCIVHRRYSDSNLGCRRNVSTGLGWVFELAEHCIVLEDDCVPEPSFFPYCQALLAAYRNDARVMAISGNNFQRGGKRTQYSYYFSDMAHVWGWASGRRAWQKYDAEMKLWPEIKSGNWLRDLLADEEEVRFWTRCFDMCAAGLDTWDFQWLFACWVNRGLCILPSVNLISNIGFDRAEATHTTNPEDPWANLPRQAISLPLLDPPFVIRDRDADRFTFRNHFRAPLPKRLRQRLARIGFLRFLVRRWRARLRPHGGSVTGSPSRS